MNGRIGFGGAGAMGGPMVRRLIAHGHDLVVCDSDEAARGGRPCGRGADRRLPCRGRFAGTPRLREPADPGHRGGGRPRSGRHRRGRRGRDIRRSVHQRGPTWPSVSPRACPGRGIVAIDAPVSGGIAGASAGTLAVMASGPRSAFEAVEGILRIIGGNTFHIGEAPGSGQMMKIVNNLLSATAMAATGEAVVLGVKAGLDPDVMIKVFNASSGMNTATRDKFPRAVLPRTFDFGFRTELLAKDVRLCVDQAERLGVPMWVGQAVRQWWSYAHARGRGHRGLHQHRALHGGTGRCRGAFAEERFLTGMIVWKHPEERHSKASDSCDATAVRMRCGVPAPVVRRSACGRRHPAVSTAHRPHGSPVRRFPGHGPHVPRPSTGACVVMNGDT